jgi:hypothetical protein
MNPWLIVRVIGVATAIVGLVFRERELRERRRYRELREEELNNKRNEF